MKKILIIDDEKDLCYFVKKNLEAMGAFEVAVCYNGAGGIKLAKELRPDLILLDILMPGVDGVYVAESLKANKDTEHIPIIFLTAMVGEKEAEERKNIIGGWHYIAKPVKVKELLQLINTLLT